jgi:DNA-binding FadR family transcriptional regulator
LSFKVDESRRLYRQIAKHLRNLIDSGEYPIGGRLPSERELADRLQVSRTSVREALIALEVEGLVRINVGSGIYVLGPSASSSTISSGKTSIEGPFEILHAREILEPSVAAEAATLADSEHVGTLDRILAQMEKSGGGDDKWISLDREFHVAIAASLSNGVLARFIGQLFDQRMNPYFRRLANYFEDARTWSQALAEHRVIRDAIAAGDPEAARQAMRQHLKLSQERFSRSFGEAAVPSHRSGKVTPVLRSRAERPHELQTKTSRRKI